MSDYLSGIDFSPTHSAKRLKKASNLMGENVIKKFLAFALYLMGANRKDISRQLSIPLGTLLSLLNRISQQGLPAIEDRRHRRSHFLPPRNREESQIEISPSKTEIILGLGTIEKKIRIPIHNSLQTKVFLLTLMQNGFILNAEVSKILNYSPTHIWKTFQVA